MAIQITYLVLSLGAFFSSFSVLSPLPRVLAAAPVNRARAGQRQQVRRESRTQETSRARRSAGRRSTRKRTKSLHDGRSRLPVCHRLPPLPSSDFDDMVRTFRDVPHGSTREQLCQLEDCSRYLQDWRDCSGPYKEHPLPCAFRRGTGNPPNRVQTPLGEAPEGRGKTTKPGATTEPAARRKNPCVPRQRRPRGVE